MSGATGRSWIGVVPLLLLLALAGPAWAADSVADFFHGRTIRLIVGFGAGGGYDLYARLLSRYLGAHVPGQPSVVVENMDGAGGLRAANYIYGVAPKDGTVIAAVNQNTAIYQILGGKGALYKAADINWLGSMAHSNETLYAWAATGVTTLDQARTRAITLGGTSATSDSYIYPTIINDLLGTKFKVINGYTGSKEINLALERGEVMGRGGNSWASVSTADPGWIAEKKINLLVQIGAQKEADLPQVPLLFDLVKGDADRQTVKVIALPSSMGYTDWLPPGVPAARVAALRAAYDATLKDPALLDEARHTAMMIRPQTGAEIAAAVQEIAETPKPVLDRTAALLGWR